MTAEVPSDSARTRAIVIVVLAGIAFAVAVGAIWLAIRPKDDAPQQTEIEPAQETSATTSAPVPGTQLATSSVAPVEGEDAESGKSTPQPASGRRTIAYRLGEGIYVASEDGSDSRSVSVAGQGYSLSPDGRTLAVVSATAGGTAAITLVDVETGLTRAVGRDALPVAPSWSPDSAWLAYTAGAGDASAVKGVAADGTGDAVLIDRGAMPVISPDGRTIAFKVSDQPGLEDPLLVLTAGTVEASAVKNSGGALSWAWGPGPTLYFTKAGTEEGSWQLWSWKGGTVRRLGTTTLSAPAFALGDLAVSPGGEWIAMAAMGDDDHSRLTVFSVKDSRFSRISTRRDAYPSRWSSAGHILFFEGNSYQGEPSALMSVRPDGTGRRTVVPDAQP